MRKENTNVGFFHRRCAEFSRAGKHGMALDQAKM
jgi:hypothetical protein